MKKIIISIFILCSLELLLCACSNRHSLSSDINTSVPDTISGSSAETTTANIKKTAEESEAPHIEQQEKCLQGTVYDATMQNITVEDKNGKLYSFFKDPDVLTLPAAGITLGASVSVRYYGELDVEKNKQNMVIINITVYDITEIQRVTQIIREMTLEEKVGQMFLARCPNSFAAKKAAQYFLGGYTLYADDFQNQTAETMTNTLANYQSATKIPLLLAVDEEGGTVTRISQYPAFRATPFLSPQKLYQQGGINAIIEDTREKAQLLSTLGINVNLAPVCDISTDRNDYIFQRSFGQTASLTSEYVQNVVAIMQEENIGSCLKHFPGYGNNIDTHTGIAVDKRSYENFINNDFLPFKAGIEAGANAVLVSHNIIQCMDATYPASLSAVVHRILREDLAFEGVIMTDDLSMDAIKKYTDDKKAAVAAVLAGNDLLCCTDFEEQIPAVIAAVKDGTLNETQINASVQRILLWKIGLGLI